MYYAHIQSLYNTWFSLCTKLYTIQHYCLIHCIHHIIISIIIISYFLIRLSKLVGHLWCNILTVKLSFWKCVTNIYIFSFLYCIWTNCKSFKSNNKFHFIVIVQFAVPIFIAIVYGTSMIRRLNVKLVGCSAYNITYLFIHNTIIMMLRDVASTYTGGVAYY